MLTTMAGVKEKMMKVISRTLFCLFFSALLSVPVFSDQLAANLDAKVLESFDDDPTSRWIARGSKFTKKIYDENGNVVDMYPKIAEAPGFPAALRGIGFKDLEGKLKILGVKASFSRKGYNYIEIIPASPADAGTPEKDIIYEDISTGTKWIHAPIEIPGRVQYFDMWVWGSNHNYTLYAHFEDYRGIGHSFRMGDLTYPGWKNLRVVMPASIPQSTRYLPKFKSLVFTKFVIWTTPNEKVDEFYVYFDHLKVLTDMFQTRFDGDELVSPDLLEQVWGASSE